MLLARWPELASRTLISGIDRDISTLVRQPGGSDEAWGAHLGYLCAHGCRSHGVRRRRTEDSRGDPAEGGRGAGAGTIDLPRAIQDRPRGHAGRVRVEERGHEPHVAA